MSERTGMRHAEVKTNETILSSIWEPERCSLLTHLAELVSHRGLMFIALPSLWIPPSHQFTPALNVAK